MASGDARPVPQKGVAFRVTFPILDDNGDLVAGAATLDSEVSKDGGTFADCTNEATEIATSSGMYYLDLTSTEMDADTVAVIVKTGTAGAKTTPIVLYPEEAGDVRVNVTQLAGSTIDSTSGLINANVKQISTDATAADNAESFFDGTGYAGTGNTIPTVTTVNGFGTGAITAAAIAADAIGASELAADAVAEIADAVWDEIASGHVVSGSFGQALNLVRSGTAQAGAAGTITLDASASASDDFYNGCLVFITGGAGAGQARLITDYVGSTKVASVSPNWVTNPDATSVFVILPMSRVDLGQWVGVAPSALQSGRVDSYTGAMAAGVVDAAAIGTGAIDADAIAANAIGASELAADAVTEIQAGLATSAEIAALNNLSAAQVNAEVVDALATDTYAEPGSVPAATSSLKDKIGWVFSRLRNKELQTATTATLRNDGDSGDLATAGVSDNGTTFTRDKWA